MSRLTRRLDNTVQDVRELLDRMVVLEAEPSLVAAGLNQVSWHIFDLRRALAKDLRASGRTWRQIGATMGISHVSALRQWGAVDGELLANIAAGYRPRATLRAEDRARAAAAAVDSVAQPAAPHHQGGGGVAEERVQVPGQLDLGSLDDGDSPLRC